jgi:cell division inhibitor SepF
MAGAMRKMGIYLGLVEDDERRGELAEYEEYDEYADAEVVPARRERMGRGWDDADARAESRAALAHEDGYREPTGYRLAVDEPAYRITTLHPRTYNEARTIGEHFRDGTPVIMNLTEMDDADAKRLVDFAAGLSFGLRGSIERVTNKVFLLSPQNVHVTAEDKARIAEGGFFNQS